MPSRVRSSRPNRGTNPVTPETIKTVAIKLFSNRGYPVIGMRDLSEAVGILPGSLYSHIESKEALLLEIVRSGVNNFTAEIAPIVASEGPADVRLRSAIRAHMSVLAVTHDQTRVTFHQWHYLTGANRTRMLEARQAYEDLFSDLLKQGVDDGSLRDFAQRKNSALTVIGILGSATEWFSPTGPASPEEVGDAMADVVLLGLGRG